MKKPFVVVVTGESLAKEAQDLLSQNCRIVFTGTYPAPSVLADKLREENAGLGGG